jgi:hypothetical protein
MTLPTIQISASSLAARIAKTTPPPAAGTGTAGFLKFAFDTGEWAFGREQEEVGGDLLLVNTNSICHGWILWADNKATKTLVTFDQDMPEQPMPVGVSQPSEARAFAGAFYDDGKPGENAIFETNSFGGRKAVDGLIREVYTRVVAGEAEFIYPLVKLDNESYRNKKYMNKLIYNPVFTIEGWCNQGGALQSSTPALDAPDDAPDDEPEAAPQPVRRRRVES